MSSKQPRPLQEPERMSTVDLQSDDSRAPSPVPLPVDIEGSPSEPNSDPEGWVYQALYIVSFSQVILMLGLARCQSSRVFFRALDMHHHSSTVARC